MPTRTASRSTPPDARPTHAPTSVLRSISLAEIQLPTRRARHDLGDLLALAASLADYGLLQPVTVRGDASGYVLTSGLRRYEAAQRLGWTTIPAFVRDRDADQAYLEDLVENLQRENLSEQEEAAALTELVRTRGWTLEQVAHAIHRSLAYVSKRVRVFEDPALRRAVSELHVPVSTAEELLALPGNQREAMMASVVEQGWDVPTVRAVVKQALASTPPVERARAADAEPPSDSARPISDRGVPVKAPLPSNEIPDVLPGRGSTRPAAFTESIRAFHNTLLRVHAADLNEADRVALRSLFRDLVVLAQAPAVRRQPVLPPLPGLS